MWPEGGRRWRQRGQGQGQGQGQVGVAGEHRAGGEELYGLWTRGIENVCSSEAERNERPSVAPHAMYDGKRRPALGDFSSRDRDVLAYFASL